jgi:hypothetical protein
VVFFSISLLGYRIGGCFYPEVYLVPPPSSAQKPIENKRGARELDRCCFLYYKYISYYEMEVKCRSADFIKRELAEENKT